MTYIPMQEAQREDISIQQEQLAALRVIAAQLAEVTGNEIKEDEVNG